MSKVRVRESKAKTEQDGRIILTSKAKLFTEVLRIHYVTHPKERGEGVDERVVIEGSCRTKRQLPYVIHKKDDYQIWRVPPCPREGHRTARILVLIHVEQEVREVCGLLSGNYFTAKALRQCKAGHAVLNGVLELLKHIPEGE